MSDRGKSKPASYDEEIIEDPNDPEYYGNRRSYDEFIKEVNGLISKSDLKRSVEAFETESAALKAVLRHSLPIIKSQPLLTAFLLWTKVTIKPVVTDYVRLLFDKGLVPFKTKKGALLLINELEQDHLIYLINVIRSQRDLKVKIKEELVWYFLDFCRWLYSETFSTIFNISDPDLIWTQSRELHFRSFSGFIEELDEKFQLIAKLLYYGECTMAQILSLKVQDIDIANTAIMFDEGSVKYPRHVLEGLKALVGEKRSGKIFIGRNNAVLNPATVFRNFKEASLKAHFDRILTPGDLQKSNKNI